MQELKDDSNKESKVEEVVAQEVEVINESLGLTPIVEDVGDNNGNSKSGMVEQYHQLSPNQPLDSNFKSIEETAMAIKHMQEIARVFIKSGLSPLKKEEDVILAIVTGNQYGFAPTTSIQSIYPINGRASLSTHLHRALIIKGGIFFKKIYNYEPCYQYAKRVEDKIEIVGSGPKGEKPEGTTCGLKVVDYITKYVFKREVRIGGKLEVYEVESEFKISEADGAGLLVKDNWKNYPARMCDARAFSIGAKEIAADILMGIPSVNELADETNVNYTIDSNFQERLK